MSMYSVKVACNLVFWSKKKKQWTTTYRPITVPVFPLESKVLVEHSVINLHIAHGYFCISKAEPYDKICMIGSSEDMFADSYSRVELPP